MAMKDRQVAYLYDEEIGNYSYGGGNPMRPHRWRPKSAAFEGPLRVQEM